MLWCQRVFHAPDTSAAPRGCVWWGNSYFLLPLPPPGWRACFRVQSWDVSENETPLLRVLRCPQIPLEVTWSSLSQSWKVHLQEGGGILAWVPVLSCIWCVVHSCLQPLSSGERLGWVVFAFPVLVWEGCVSGTVVVDTVSSALPGPLVF